MDSTRRTKGATGAAATAMAAVPCMFTQRTGRYAVAMEAAMVAPKASVSSRGRNQGSEFPWRCARYGLFSGRIGQGRRPARHVTETIVDSKGGVQ
jgi:hypothetical protein